MTNAARLTFYRYRDEVGVAVFDLGDGHAIWVDATLVGVTSPVSRRHDNDT